MIARTRRRRRRGRRWWRHLPPTVARTPGTKLAAAATGGTASSVPTVGAHLPTAVGFSAAAIPRRLLLLLVPIPSVRSIAGLLLRHLALLGPLLPRGGHVTAVAGIAALRGRPDAAVPASAVGIAVPVRLLVLGRGVVIRLLTLLMTTRRLRPGRRSVVAAAAAAVPAAAATTTTTTGIGPLMTGRRLLRTNLRLRLLLLVRVRGPRGRRRRCHLPLLLGLGPDQGRIRE
mmetsp:Transcript_26130/g.61014  ORF Transcript_26130/g.61014 Transcript_26130/m.61014 type:complete len:230 (+) Transcript_26130:988-1677(+)